jgi:hypothetical protein
LPVRNIRRLRAGRAWLQRRRSNWRPRVPRVSLQHRHSNLRQSVPLVPLVPPVPLVSPPPLAPQTTNQPRRSLSTPHALAVAADQPRHSSPEPLRLMSCIHTGCPSNTHRPAEKDSYCLDFDH